MVCTVHIKEWKWKHYLNAFFVIVPVHTYHIYFKCLALIALKGL